jgi:hypothetical protein
MIRRAALFVGVPLLLYVGIASAQESFPIMEKVAQKVIEHYQTSSCQALAQQKSQPPTGEKAQLEQRAVQLLRDDPQMRTEFLNRVAAPIVNKLFECGMIP